MGSDLNKPDPVLMEYGRTLWLLLPKEKFRYQKQDWYVVGT